MARSNRLNLVVFRSAGWLSRSLDSWIPFAIFSHWTLRRAAPALRFASMLVRRQTGARLEDHFSDQACRLVDSAGTWTSWATDGTSVAFRKSNSV